MKVIGIDFTSRPTTKKPLTCLYCILEEKVLRASSHVERWSNFGLFEEALTKPGPWIAGIDFPFGQSRKFIKNIGWPNHDWAGYVQHAELLGREGFRRALDAYRSPRPIGDKEHRRGTDIAAGSVSPQKLYGVPVGLMFFEGAPRLIKSGVKIPELQSGDSDRIVVEAYPGVLARHIIGKVGYKSDTVGKQTEKQRQARLDMLEHMNDRIESGYGLRVKAPNTLANDPSGDELDALLCAIQAAWAWTMKERGYGAPANVDALEGWIANPPLPDLQ